MTRTSFLLALMLASACKQPGDTDPSDVPLPPELGSLEWTTCPFSAEVECATLEVPVDHDDATSGATMFRMMRLPATSDDVLGHLWFNPGGPGESFYKGVTALDGVFTPAVRERYHVATWGVRGTEGSGDTFDCGGIDLFGIDRTPDTETEWTALEQLASDFATACADEPLLGWAGPLDVARDMEWMRIAAGDEKLNAVVWSYGGVYAMEYADRYPETVGRMVIDSPLSPAATFADWDGTQGAAQDALLNAALDAFDQTPGGFGDGDAHGAFEALLQSLDAEPLVVDDRTIDDSDLLMALILAPYNTTSETTYQDLVGELLADASDAGAMVDPFSRPGGFADPMLAMVCDHDAHPESARGYIEARAAESRAGAVLSTIAAHCAVWPTPSRRMARPLQPVGLPPVLVLTGDDDFAAPRMWAEEVAGMLDDVALVTGPKWGHTQYHRSAATCLTTAVDTYLLEGTLPEAGRPCDQ